MSYLWLRSLVETINSSTERKTVPVRLASPTIDQRKMSVGLFRAAVRALYPSAIFHENRVMFMKVTITNERGIEVIVIVDGLMTEDKG
jgi:hypothetical protein